MSEFMECATCRVKPGHPTLCQSCLNNRTLIEKMQHTIAKQDCWIADIQSAMYVNCVYCGHRYGPGETTPVSMADALKAHIEQCSKHPMSALKVLLREARKYVWLTKTMPPPGEERSWEHSAAAIELAKKIDTALGVKT